MDVRGLKAQLPRTWGAFFERHGAFTPAQIAAIPPLLAGDNVMLCAPTASGKTEAALAPLIERVLPANRPPSRLTLLYLLPTRALVNDLYNRLSIPLERLQISCAVKTHDFNTFDTRAPDDLLLTTPESLDALMAANARVLMHVRAVVIDELHQLDGTTRGDQLRVLLNRLRRLRSYAHTRGDADNADVQFAALSATLAHPQAAADRYFSGARVVAASGERALHLEMLDLDPDSPAALFDYLRTFQTRGWRKALAFCNTRAEVEAYAAAVRRTSTPFGDAVYVHYSNLEAGRRREIEASFAAAEVAICFASSTLELGIDVGSIDAVLLIGAPGSYAAFAQRIGRGGRRRGVIQAACFARTPLETALFKVFSTHAQPSPADAVFHSSVAVQQIFSLLKQSPTGTVRPAQLIEMFAGMLSAEEITPLVGHLQALRFLQPGRPGEWRAGERLNRLIDEQATSHSTLSIYSNLQVDPNRLQIRDRASGRVVASVGGNWFDRDVLTLEGRPVNIEWYDGEALWVSPMQGAVAQEAAGQMSFVSARQMLSVEVARALPEQFGLAPDSAPLIETDGGWLWFHWMGDVYGLAVLDLLAYTLPVQATAQPGLCILLAEPIIRLPTWTEAQIRRYLNDRYRRYESMLAPGAFHHLLPQELRRQAVIEQFNVRRFAQRVAALGLSSAPEAIRGDLLSLLAER